MLEADSYDVLGLAELQNIFIPIPDDETLLAAEAAAAAPEEIAAIDEMLAEKPEAEPSDLQKAEDGAEEEPSGQ